ncbi:uncharacterized protein LOC126999881 isoform X2 [Eriocheir sinensis]|nr:uncharacterized protein LOC126999881 isoform X2 [Eriocheir sinensis]
MKHQQRVRRAMMTPGQHDPSEVEQLSKEVIDLSLNPPTIKASTASDLSSSIHTSSPTTHLSPSSSCSSASLSSIAPCYSSVSSTITSSSFPPSFTSFPCPTFQSGSFTPHYVGMTEGEASSHYLSMALKPSLSDMREKRMAGEGAAHTQLLSLPRPVTCTSSLLPPPGTTSPPLPLYSSDQGNQSASNPHDPKEIAEPHRAPQAPADFPSRAHLLMTQEQEALHVRKEREMLPMKSLTLTSTNHRVLKPHPIGSSWFQHHALYPEWGTFYQTCHPSPPPPPPPPLPYPFHTFPPNRDAGTQPHVSPWYPGPWCLQCHLQNTHMHTRPYSYVPHPDLPRLPTVTSSSVTFPFATAKETSTFSGSHFAHTTDTLSPHK